MAEFCYRCVNKMDKTDYPKMHFVLTRYLHLCEGCAAYKRVVVRMRDPVSLFFVKRFYGAKGFYIRARRKAIKRKVLKQKGNRQ